MNPYKPLLEQYPKAKPLAKTLIAAASEQGASVEELDMACAIAVEIAKDASRKAIEKQLVSRIQCDAEAILDSI